MGCVSSKIYRKEFNEEEDLLYNNHIVSLTSTTLGALKLDQVQQPTQESKISSPDVVVKISPKKVSEEPEVINTWELMSDLEEEEEMRVPNSTPKSRKSPKLFLETSRSRFFPQINSPNKAKRFSGKENKQGGKGRFETTTTTTPSPSPLQVLRPFNSTGNLRKRVPPTLRLPLRNTSVDLVSRNSFKVDSGNSTSRRSLGPMFDPELIASFEREINVNEEQIKKIVSVSLKPRNSKARDSELMLEKFEKKCPNGGEKSVIIYTTTLRGIRRTFEDCNIVRSVIESHQIQMSERDISMDSGYREELRVVMGKKGISVPIVFVKGRLIGGVDEVMKLEEEGTLEILFDGVPKATAPCEGCAGMGFVMCMDCSGSCKVLDEVEKKKMIKCGECNENGLIHCPICC